MLLLRGVVFRESHLNFMFLCFLFAARGCSRSVSNMCLSNCCFARVVFRLVFCKCALQTQEDLITLVKAQEVLRAVKVQEILRAVKVQEALTVNAFREVRTVMKIQEVLTDVKDQEVLTAVKVQEVPVVVKVQEVPTAVKGQRTYRSGHSLGQFHVCSVATSKRQGMC